MARLANSLVQLRAEINAAAPNRSKRSDGWIGDAAHRDRCSRHNPNNFGVVCAFDATDDPDNGCDIHAIAKDLVSKARQGQTNPCLEYVISNGRIASRSGGFVWRTYGGSNPHTRHVHFAVGRGSDCEPFAPYDDTTAWGVTAKSAPVPQLPINDFARRIRMLPTLRRGSKGQHVRNMQGLLIAHGNNIVVDGDFGPRTEAILKDWQRRTGKLVADGICGPATWTWLVSV